MKRACAYPSKRRGPGVLMATTCLTGLVAAAPVNAADPSAGVSPSATSVGEVVVTASRRSESLTKLPFSISAYGGKNLARANITNVASLSQQVPNFVIQDQGPARSSGAIPIIRGLNSSQPTLTAARYFQSPVGIYDDNAPVTGSLPLQDVERVEVLRGPQGTLYGAGALSGAVRIVQVEPQLNSFSGLVSGSVAAVSHSSDFDNDLLGVVNIPLGKTAAMRVSVQREYDAGFIDQHDIMRRVGNNYVSGAPVLADPNDVANSPAVYFNKNDVNVATITSVFSSILWKPSDALKILGSYKYSYVSGNGVPLDNYTYQGGPSPIDPRITFSPTGQYQRSLAMLEPFNRRSQLASVDVSYDLGFATLASTVAYGETSGTLTSDGTSNLLGSPYGYYYTGVPANPRAVIPVTDQSKEDAFTEEVRLVSREGGAFDYIVGAFFEQERRHIGLYIWNPGADVQSAAAHGGSTLPMILGGTYIPLFANSESYIQDTHQNFNDYSVYGDLTWHITDRWQITGGARVFYQTFSQQYYATSSIFMFNINPSNSTSVTNEIFKANTSYKLDASNQAYFTFSQGFRRGGANAFPTTGLVEEPAQLLTYKPDTTNNFEVGIKGVVSGLRYAAALFYIDWQNPQIDLLSPFNLQAEVVNANAANSKGAEFELAGPIGPRGLTFDLGLSYARARLSQDFGLPAGSGVGSIIPDAIVGKAGDRLPGAPDFSASGNVHYEMPISSGSVLFTVGADYRGSTVNILPNINSNTPATIAPGYALMHGSIVLDAKNWEVELYGTNLLDSHVVQSTTVRTVASVPILGGWANSYAVARPREVGLRVTRRF